jgi:serine phosphatase RsbU (regulator of sigma subunit)
MGIGFVGKNIFDGVLEEIEVPLKSDELLIMFSDGITELRNISGEELGYDRFAEIARASRAETDTQKMIDYILHEVLLFAGAPSFSDDATFIVIRKL